MDGIQIVVVLQQQQPQEQWETNSNTNLNGRRDEGNGVLELRRHAQDGLVDLLDNIGAVTVVRSDDVEALPSASNGANTLVLLNQLQQRLFPARRRDERTCG